MQSGYQLIVAWWHEHNMSLGTFAIALTLTWGWLLDAKSPQDPGSSPWPEGLGMLDLPSGYSLLLYSPVLKHIWDIWSKQCCEQTRSITELAISCSFCLLVYWPLMTAHVEEPMFGVCHTLVFTEPGDNTRIIPHSSTHFSIKVKGKTLFYNKKQHFLIMDGWRQEHGISRQGSVNGQTMSKTLGVQSSLSASPGEWEASTAWRSF